MHDHATVALLGRRNRIVLESLTSHPESIGAEDFMNEMRGQIIAKWSGNDELTVEIGPSELRAILENLAQEIKILKAKVSDLESNEHREKKLNTQKIVVPDYKEDDIQEHKKMILSLLAAGKTLNPFDYAEQMDIEVGLALLCFDELIEEGKLEKVNGKRTQAF